MSHLSNVQIMYHILYIVYIYRIIHHMYYIEYTYFTYCFILHDDVVPFVVSRTKRQGPDIKGSNNPDPETEESYCYGRPMP